MTDAEIYDRLAPYSRRCVTPCGECQGKERHVYCSLCGRRGTDGLQGYSCTSCSGGKWVKFHCPACSGTGLVFREDERGRELIQLACGWWWVETKYRVFQKSAFIAYTNADGDGRVCHWAWENRHNKPWRESLEQFVREYEADPPDLSCDELKRLLLDAGYEMDFRARPKHGKRWWAAVRKEDVNGWHSSIGDSEAAALRAAVEKMLEGK